MEGKAPSNWRFAKGMEPRPQQDIGTTSENATTENQNPPQSNISTPVDTYALNATSRTLTYNPTIPPPDVYNNRHDLIHPAFLKEEHESRQEKGSSESSEIDVLEVCTVPKTECQCCLTGLVLASTSFTRSLMDSGASDHCWKDRESFGLYKRVDGRGQTAQAGATGQFPIPGVGEVRLGSMKLNNVRHTPTFENNLLSMPTLDSEGYHGEWGNGRITVRSPTTNQVVLSASMRGKMYEVDQNDGTGTSAAYSRSLDRPVGIMTWHRRFGHNGTRRILRLAHKKMVDGLHITSREVVGMCEDCLFGKAMR